jgi:hypothetical protein
MEEAERLIRAQQSTLAETDLRREREHHHWGQTLTQITELLGQIALEPRSSRVHLHDSVVMQGDGSALGSMTGTLGGQHKFRRIKAIRLPPSASATRVVKSNRAKKDWLKALEEDLA